MTKRACAPNWSAAWLASRPLRERARFLNGLSPAEIDFLLRDWAFWARPEQCPPLGAWTTWLFLGGRGAGKTRAGAEWIADRVRAGLSGRIALVAEDLGDARAVMAEGPSGLLAVARPGERPRHEATRRRLLWPNGAQAHLFGAHDPDALRGPQFDAAWSDELAKWPNAEATWANLQLALRLGEDPRQAATTTPRPTRLLKGLIDDRRTVVTRSTTAANAAHLAPTFLSEVVARYRGTRLGRQELEGEMLEDHAGALWRLDRFDALRVEAAPALDRVSVAVDPPASTGPEADACGIVAAGRAGARAYVLADATAQGLSPLDWARRVVRTAESFAADRIVVETNQGGAMAEHVLAQAAPPCPVRAVKARASKLARAAPVAALYEQGRVAHVGVHAALEDEMAAFGADEGSGSKSPDRTDALVWALTDLMLGREGAPAVRRL